MIDPIANVQVIVKELDVPSWLQTDLLPVLKSKQKKMSNEDIRNWLKHMATGGDFTIPEEFQDGKN